MSLSVDKAQAKGARVVDQLLAEAPARQAVWAEVSDDDRDLATTWLGLSRLPWISSARRRRIASALDVDAVTVHHILHSRGEVPHQAGVDFPPF